MNSPNIRLFLSALIRMYTHTRTYTHMHVHIPTHTITLTSTHTCTWMCAHTRTHTQTHTDTHTTLTQTHTHVHIHTHVHTCIHMYAYTHTHKPTCTHTHSLPTDFLYLINIQINRGFQCSTLQPLLQQFSKLCGWENTLIEFVGLKRCYDRWGREWLELFAFPLLLSTWWCHFHQLSEILHKIIQKVWANLWNQLKVESICTCIVLKLCM